MRHASFLGARKGELAMDFIDERLLESKMTQVEQARAWSPRVICREVLLAQAPARLGSRQALSKGKRQAWGAMSWWTDFGPHEPGW
jgi:hypothetical protein